MGAATGLAAVLARSVPPVPDAAPAPSRILELSGYPDPGPMTGADWFTAWRIDWLFLGTAVLAVGPLPRRRRRGCAGAATPGRCGRTICWVIGWALFVWATCSAPGIWGRVLFSTHMVMHMAVAMTVPLFLVPGAPLTLALRALKPRPDKTWGPREVLLQVVHSRAMQVLANPVVAACLFFFSLAAFYWTGLFQLSLTTHTGHLLMMAHFLLTGYLFVWVLIGIDPGPPRWSPLMLLVILFATISFHAFFGVALTGSETLLAPDFFGQINLPWGPDPLLDQHRAGEIAWGFGEAPDPVPRGGRGLPVVQARRAGDPAQGPPGRPRRRRRAQRLQRVPRPAAQRGRPPQLTRLPRGECGNGRYGNHFRTHGRMGGMRIAVVQLGYDDDEPFGARVDRVAALVADQAGHDLVVLPELWGATGFDYTRWAGEAQPLDGPWASGDGGCRARGIRDPARRLVRRAAARAGCRRQRPRQHLTAPGCRWVASRGLPQDPPVRVRGGGAAAMEAGVDVVVTEIPSGTGGSVTVGLSTCYDLRFPELYRQQVEAGAELFVVPAAWPAARVGHWTLLGRARAIENQCVVVQCNTAGTHAGYEMGGHSQVVTASGEVLAEATGSEQQVLSVEVDLEATTAYREAFPVLDDRRL